MVSTIHDQIDALLRRADDGEDVTLAVAELAVQTDSPLTYIRRSLNAEYVKENPNAADDHVDRIYQDALEDRRRRLGG